MTARKPILLAVFVLCFSTAISLACYYRSSLDALVESNPAADGSFDLKLVENARAVGYPALDDLLAMKSECETRLMKMGFSDESTHPVPQQDSNATQDAQLKLVERLDRINRLIDAVGGQRHCTKSKLFWHTDLDRALQFAKAENKPVLSLRMLGKLTDEYSCANSRFFRTALYSNKEISESLRKNFVLHWKSVRPVPRITIDFGDGRTLERTITGNSAHYLLDSNGRPLDCLPGMYGPPAFMSWLSHGKELVAKFESLEPASRDAWLVEYHQQRLNKLTDKLFEGLGNQASQGAQAERVMALSNRTRTLSNRTRKNGPIRNSVPTAAQAAPVAISKGRVEAPILKLAFDQEVKTELVNAQMEGLDSAFWKRFAQGFAGLERLDRASVALMEEENVAEQANNLTASKAFVEAPIMRMVRSFQKSILLDTVRNEYTLHRTIHGWFVEQPYHNNVEELNSRVYADLFLTPDSDPWLGLKPKDTYTALENDGVSLVKQ